ncbi:hypothetical protein SAMN05443094_103490 [Domibacillus enclensis]|uniref:Uncharacterized protein n=1 Tax=Domibacillus enclensis TaxID=1017273 RepID=A0A1N6V917_9BACI|nr:hypothetical protein SAMN05443094_103490 [Domibacillus enclensis]
MKKADRLFFTIAMIISILLFVFLEGKVGNIYLVLIIIAASFGLGLIRRFLFKS